MKKTKTQSKSKAAPKAAKPTKIANKTVSKVQKAPVKAKPVAASKNKIKTVAPKKMPTIVAAKSPLKKMDNVIAKKMQTEVKAIADKVQKAPKSLPAIKNKKSDNKLPSTPVRVQTQGHARVIEPLSWDAEKPKLNLSLTNKISRKDKDKEEAEVKSYSIKSRYTVGDRVMHTDFGKGLVRDLIGDFKIRVAFRDFEKVLVHGIN